MHVCIRRLADPIRWSSWGRTTSASHPRSVSQRPGGLRVRQERRRQGQVHHPALEALDFRAHLCGAVVRGLRRIGLRLAEHRADHRHGSLEGPVHHLQPGVRGLLQRLKNSRLVKAKKHRRPEKLYRVILSKDVAGSVHRYKNVPHDANIGCRSVLIKRETFAPRVQNSSLPLSELSPTQPTPPCYTSGANEFGRGWAGLQVFRDLHKTGDLNGLNNLWIGRGLPAPAQARRAQGEHAAVVFRARPLHRLGRRLVARHRGSSGWLSRGAPLRI